ncbi:hypothetical protein CHS0354_020381 [Potamilus streckersoni]|uniref:Peptidoglycan recognition protein family domain-containing protein n=1 Tax=Potamilus streckersoni TaxID=2493646 RepID=A0AAE0TFU8_9BIVA|nr:hypothetical protein CHS0354_020381 [Potamilus streckersoni]
MRADNHISSISYICTGYCDMGDKLFRCLLEEKKEMNSLLLVCFALLAYFEEVYAGQCACAEISLNVLSGASHTSQALRSLSIGDCLTYYDHDEIGLDGIKWASVDYNGQKAWINKRFVNIKPCILDKRRRAVQLSGCPHIVTRAEWGARAPTSHSGHLPAIPKYVFIHHGASPGCHTKTDCIAKVRSYQNYHMDGHHWSDIGYSFIVGEDGHVYEGRGWDEIGAHTYNYNSVGLGNLL